MDVSDLLNDLNAAQREAVGESAGHMLVLAGAGSGKTRVLIHRLAWLIGVENISPQSIMAVTFTNKAAQEMRARIETLLGHPVSGMWIGTFHGLSHRLLRTHWQQAKLPQSFQILDSEDQLRLIKRILKNMELDESFWPPKQAQGFINRHKEAGRRPANLGGQADPQHQQLTRIYREYEETCQRSGLVDFAELLLRSFELLRDDPQISAHYQTRFRHLLVDEFQDTNNIQYQWLRQFAGAANYIFAVGDDDQSIYSWRGAEVENMEHFRRDYKNVKLVRLEQNYRSTQTILQAANAVISYNQKRLGKNLWSEGKKGPPIKLYTAMNELDEAQFVIDQIQSWQQAGGQLMDCAILYRSNAQSRVFEEALLASHISYRVYGGMRFFERTEIKHALAYLRLLYNRADDAAFERIANVPTRGISPDCMDLLRQHARQHQLSLWDAATALIEENKLTTRRTKAVSHFLELIEEIYQSSIDQTLTEIIELVIHQSGLLEHFQQEKGEKAEARVENLRELVSAGRFFEKEGEEGLSPLLEFLSHAALEAGEAQADAGEDCVQLMSLHSAKGLEFPIIFLTGVEEGLFPHQRSIHEPGRLEEERRLCYVGMTRAMYRLYITHAESRRLYGNEQYAIASRFISEIPAELIDSVRPQGLAQSFTATSADIDSPSLDWRLGQRVRHSSFGEGIILSCEGSGSHARVQVNFDSVGAKWLVLAYANLEAL